MPMYFVSGRRKTGITVSGERKSINSNRGQQKYDIAGNATRQSDRTEPTVYQGPVVQSIVSLTTSLWRHSVKYMLITFANTMLFLLEKCENLLQYKSIAKDCHILRQNVTGYL